MAIQRLPVIGVKRSKGNVEGGQAYDFSTIYAIAPLAPSDTSAGFSGIDMRGLPEVSIPFLDFAFKQEGTLFDLDIQQFASGKGGFKDTVVSMTLVVDKPNNNKPL